MANLRAVEDQEPRRLVDEDTDQHSHPLFRMSPGMKMLGAEEEKESKRYLRRNERFRRNVSNISRNNTDNISKRGDMHEPPTVTSQGKEAEGRRTSAEVWPKDQTPGRK